jgi:hypothetical protein
VIRSSSSFLHIGSLPSFWDSPISEFIPALL